jgi:hypothetical protein
MQMQDDDAISRAVCHRHPRCFGNSAISYRFPKQHHDVTKRQNCAMATFCIHGVHLEELPFKELEGSGTFLRKKKPIHHSYPFSTRSTLILPHLSVTKDGARIGNWIYHLQVATTINYNISKITVIITH